MPDRVGHDGEISPRAALGRNDSEKILRFAQDDSGNGQDDGMDGYDDVADGRGSIDVGCGGSHKMIRGRSGRRLDEGCCRCRLYIR